MSTYYRELKSPFTKIHLSKLEGDIRTITLWSDNTYCGELKFKDEHLNDIIVSFLGKEVAQTVGDKYGVGLKIFYTPRSHQIVSEYNEIFTIDSLKKELKEMNRKPIKALICPKCRKNDFESIPLDSIYYLYKCCSNTYKRHELEHKFEG